MVTDSRYRVATKRTLPITLEEFAVYHGRVMAIRERIGTNMRGANTEICAATGCQPSRVSAVLLATVYDMLMLERIETWVEENYL